VDIDWIRKQIPACQRMIYMNTGWSGPSPKSVVEAVKDRLEYESYEGPTTRPVYESGRKVQQMARDAAASLLNVTAEEITLTQCTTDGLNMVVNGLKWSEGDEVITFGLEHSSVLVPSFHLQERHGVRLRVLGLHPDDSHEDILSRVGEAITDRTRLLFFSHIQYTCGLRMPIEGLRGLTKPRGIWTFKGEGAILSSPIVAGETVYFGTGVSTTDGIVYALDRRTGEELWHLSLGSPIVLAQSLAEGKLFVRTEDGRIHAIE